MFHISKREFYITQVAQLAIGLAVSIVQTRRILNEIEKVRRGIR